MESFHCCTWSQSIPLIAPSWRSPSRRPARDSSTRPHHTVQIELLLVVMAALAEVPETFNTPST